MAYMRRRDLAWLLAAGAAVEAQTAPADDFTAAKERIKSNGAELSKYVIPMATEPAFAFKA